ncbi:MAG: hypothetical protein UX91_C0001G0050 [Candidatus Amesbacteria bacterium GW2011_GWB1_47_19]|nr:MAG: hypothetical protein UW51_C0001G0050 [Candidatus Amesbacteria bacterium GW2011_GWA1_44_24]KKU32062.1 MAG: hypothetical protein UX46_C0001G0049 [Candidatus Amesbacteria bacterium GW2011_GWC1_46_24]KKU67746.1 MAG: hypothetical protein UX91_C0001G0050 [Candidatus Amesbacteria bacterium GW2011_GWB1_47_19]OGD06069.1 MAG: hypothetical protein A2379_03175 [Candidatus Amesbacteria bacterium RIFOXYB1_FULL_47_13]HBC72341.1 hypothetical protein [Candidatus Amesbacteria bacterium]
MAKTVRVGLDFDGVVAYNPARLFRAYVKWFKRRVLGITRLTFMVPTNPVIKFLWILAHESSLFPAKGAGMLKQLSGRNDVELHLITGRYVILENNLRRWLVKYKMENLFKTVNINRECEQPHLFKRRIIEKLKLDYFVEDNLDIVQYLNGKTKTRIMWIYNITDRKKNYADKFPYLEKALQNIKV